MIIVIILSCLTITVSALPTHPNVLPSRPSQGGATQVTHQKPDAPTPGFSPPEVEQPQPGAPQQPHGGSQVLHYSWSPLEGSPLVVPLLLGVYGSQPATLPTLPQQHLILPPYRYFPLFISPYGNELLSPDRFPLTLASTLSQTPANPPQSGPDLPAETPSGAAPSQNAPQLIQQQQNPQFVYLIQQPMHAAPGSLSSEELESQMAANIQRLGVYLPSVLTNPSAGVVQPVNQAAEHSNPEERGISPTVQTLSQTQGPATFGLQPDTNAGPAGLDRPKQETSTVQTLVGPKLQPTQGKPDVKLQPNTLRIK